MLSDDVYQGLVQRVFCVQDDNDGNNNDGNDNDNDNRNDKDGDNNDSHDNDDNLHLKGGDTRITLLARCGHIPRLRHRPGPTHLRVAASIARNATAGDRSA
jgi:hypothetical protein